MTEATPDANVEHTNGGFPPSQTPAQSPQAIHSSILISDHSQPTCPDSQPSPERQPRPSNILSRIFFGRSKGINELGVEDLEKRRQAQKSGAMARKDKASPELKSRRDREESRKASMEKAKQSRKDRAKKERRLENYYSIRGYDPNAGMLRSGREEGIERRQASEETREFSGREVHGWGLEFGRPKHHKGKGHFSGQHNNCGEQYGSSAAANGD